MHLRRFLPDVALLAAMLTLVVGLPSFAAALDVGAAVPSAGSTIWGVVLQALIPIVGSALTAALAFAGQAFRAWAADKSYSTAVASLTMKVEALVAHAEAELRPDIAKALEDGKLSDEEAAALKAKVAQLVREAAGAELTVLTAKLGVAGPVVDSIISGLIEKAVTALAKSAEPKPTPAPVPLVAPVVVQGERSNSDDPQVG